MRRIAGIDEAGRGPLAGPVVAAAVILRPRRPIDGDVTEPAISAASILAKTARDSYMNQMDTIYPAYCFASHKGYATPDHQRLLNLHGPCPLHRRSFEPVRLALRCEP